jgi:hypothetical protein
MAASIKAIYSLKFRLTPVKEATRYTNGLSEWGIERASALALRSLHGPSQWTPANSRHSDSERWNAVLPLFVLHANESKRASHAAPTNSR